MARASLSGWQEMSEPGETGDAAAESEIRGVRVLAVDPARFLWLEVGPSPM
jgi:hypothetical protein